MNGWLKWSPWAVAAMLVCQNGFAQELPEAEQPEQTQIQKHASNGTVGQRARMSPINLEPERPKFVPILRERKMTEDEYFAYQHGLPLDARPLAEAPAYAEAGTRAVGPGGEDAEPLRLGYVVRPDSIRQMEPEELRSFAEHRQEHIEGLRAQMEEGLIELRAATEESFEDRPADDRRYELLRRNVERLGNEITNLEAAYVELEEFDKLDTLQDMQRRMKRARVHLQAMQSARDVEEFDSSAATLATALGIMSQQSEELAAK